MLHNEANNMILMRNFLIFDKIDIFQMSLAGKKLDCIFEEPLNLHLNVG